MVKLNEALVLARSRATDLDNVRKFNCWGSDLSDVRIIRQMPNVQVLSLSVNKISTLGDFAYSKNLEELYIRKNDIQHLNDICYLKTLPKLRILWLSDNPCASEDNYRMTVLKHLPNLQKLDNIPVLEEELNSAIEQGHDLIPPRAPTESLNIQPARESVPVTTNNSPSIVSVSMPAFSALRNITENGDADNQGCHDNSVNDAEDEKETPSENPESLSWEETNNIRVKLGLKALSVEKVTPMKPRTCTTPHSAKARNVNLLQASLLLIKELDAESLEVIADAIRNRLEAL